jgi:S-adenosylmethionine:tRNA ribosyltransferase-isomerase
MLTNLFDFELPDRLVALRPAVPRDSARLMIVSPDGSLGHGRIANLPGLLARGDCLVVNDSRVIPARIRGFRQARGEGFPARVEILLHRRLSAARFSGLARPARKLVVGDRVTFGALEAIVACRGEKGAVELEFALGGGALDDALARIGEMPLPPYIAGKRRADARDHEDYQTVFARQQGSVAAPTAGLHFTPSLLDRLAAAGIGREALTLHVGLGTFLPVTAEDTAEHRMHGEIARLDSDTAARLNRVRQTGGRLVAVGTTALRTLESAADPLGGLHPFDAETKIFITPGYRFRAVDVLLTNFHLPRSTLFMLVCAFMGLDVMKAAYEEAIRQDYRFYSYGDACLLLRPR